MSHKLELKKIVIIFLAIFLVSVSPVRAAIYLKKSSQGKIKLTDDPEENTEEYKLIVRSALPEKVELPPVKKLEEIIKSSAEKFSLPRSLIYAVMRIESDGKKKAKSEAGARGLMQLMPETARAMGVENIYDPRENIFGGSRYLKKMLSRYKGDLKLALAAYNAGPGAVDKHDGIPPFKETKVFVKKTRRAFKKFRDKSDIIYTYRDERGIIHVTNIH